MFPCAIQVKQYYLTEYIIFITLRLGKFALTPTAFTIFMNKSCADKFQDKLQVLLKNSKQN